MKSRRLFPLSRRNRGPSGVEYRTRPGPLCSGLVLRPGTSRLAALVPLAAAFPGLMVGS